MTRSQGFEGFPSQRSPQGDQTTSIAIKKVRSSFTYILEFVLDATSFIVVRVFFSVISSVLITILNSFQLGLTSAETSCSSSSVTVLVQQWMIPNSLSLLLGL